MNARLRAAGPPQRALGGRAGDFVFRWGNRLAGATRRRAFGDRLALTQTLAVTQFATTLDVGEGALSLGNAAGEVRAGGQFPLLPSIGVTVEWRVARLS